MSWFFSSFGRRIALPLLFAVLPLCVFVFTSLPGLNRLTPLLAIVFVGALIVIRFVPGVGTLPRGVLWTLLVLSLVGSTGWFYSPFFFALYLLAIGLGFLYTVGVAVTFTLALILLFAFSIGEVNPTYDFLTLISLLSVIPITIVLRRSFLLVQQARKGILILESEQGPGSGITSLDAILQNQVNRIGILIRQPLTYVKQGLSLLADGKLTESEYTDVLTRMRKSTEDMFTLVKEFESDTTKNVLLGRRGEQPTQTP